MTANGRIDAGNPSGLVPSTFSFVPVAVISAAVLLAYSNSFSGAFVFDDPSSIVANTTIRHLWPPWAAFSPPNASITVQGRPVLNFSLALNYALSGDEVWSYHALNVAIHLAAALTLYGLVRRTLLLPGLRSRFARSAEGLALSIAVLWAVHPLQTESVTYVIQRAESLMGLFYLLTLYGFVRGATGGNRIAWWSGSVGSCLLGMGTKEVMISAPLMVLLYDRTFISGAFLSALRRHRGLYASLAATWLALIYLVIGTGGNRGGSIGFGVDIRWWDYGLTQFQAIGHYLQLSLWPNPLVFEFGTFWVKNAAEVLPSALPVGALLVGTGIALRRYPALGFLGWWFFAILAPTSLAPGTTQMIVEHRMYLPLAAVVCAVVLGVYRLPCTPNLIRFMPVALTVPLGLLTAARNLDYRDELSLWSDTVAKRPGNALAHQMLAAAWDAHGDLTQAIAEYEETLRLKPNFSLPHDSLGLLLYRIGRRPEAIAHYEAALRLKPDFTDAHYNLANALAAANRPSEAIDHYEAAVRLKPDLADAHFNLANTLAATGRTSEAFEHYETTLLLKPTYPAAHYNLANLLAMSGHPTEAIPHYQAALLQKPGYAEAYNNLGSALFDLGRRSEAELQYENALRADPHFSDAQDNLARLHGLPAPTRP